MVRLEVVGNQLEMVGSLPQILLCSWSASCIHQLRGRRKVVTGMTTSLIEILPISIFTPRDYAGRFYSKNSQVLTKPVSGQEGSRI